MKESRCGRRKEEAKAKASRKKKKKRIKKSGGDVGVFLNDKTSMSMARRGETKGCSQERIHSFIHSPTH
jgi:hypothetical protein